MRLAIGLLSLLSTHCITTALHETAFPDGSEFDYAEDAISAAQFERGFAICMRGPNGAVELRLKPAESEGISALVLPLSKVSSKENHVWQASDLPGCSIQTTTPRRSPGTGSLLFSEQFVDLPHSERRAAASTAAIPAAARILSADISADKKHLRVVHEGGGPVILKRAGPGDFDPGFSPYLEDQWIAEKSPVHTTWQPLEITGQKSLAVYFTANDGRMRLQAFAFPGLAQSSIVYVPHLAERPEPERYYLLPLYPFAAVLDVLTLALQATIWYQDVRRTGACFNW